MISYLVFLPDIPNTQKLCILNNEIFFFGIITQSVKDKMYQFQNRTPLIKKNPIKDDQRCSKKPKDSKLRLITSKD